MIRRLARPTTFALRLAVVAAILALGSSPAQAKPEVYKIDKGHSAMQWKIKHLGCSYTYGRFNEFNGVFSIDDADLKNSSIEIDISTDSIDSNDEGRDKHLKGKDFFNCEAYPSLSFKSTSIEKAGDSTYRVTGKLTLLAVTKEVTLRMEKIGEADDPWGNHRMGFEGHLRIKRSDYGMKAMLNMIGDEVHLTLGVEGIRQGDKKAEKKAEKTKK